MFSLLVFLSSNKFPSNFLPSCYPCLLYIFSWFSLVLKFSQFPPNLLHLILLIPLQLNTHLKFFQITSSDKFPNSPPACYHSYPSCAICCSAIFDAMILADDALADNELIIGRRNAINTKNNPNPLHITESLDAEKQSLEKVMNGNLPLAELFLNREFAFLQGKLVFNSVSSLSVVSNGRYVAHLKEACIS